MTHEKNIVKKWPQDGFYDQYGGTYIPELLMPQVQELQRNYREIIYSPEFTETFQFLLKTYAGRPTPLYFAERLTEKYGFQIYLKREDLNHTGSHKLNNVLGQILLAKRLGKTSVIAETGAGQHGVATATVCAKMGIPCRVFMGELDVERQQPNVKRMKMLGAEVIPVTSGSKTLKDATNEALRYWIQHPDTYYLLGSAVGPHPYPEMVAYFQSVISQEIRWQLEERGINKIHSIIACVGGGSNAIGAFYHFLDQLTVRLIGVEAAGKGVHTQKTAATLSKGRPGIFHGFKSYVLQNDDGQILEAHSISAGLDYPGVGPIHAYLKDSGRATYVAVTDEEALQAAIECARLEGIIPALESAHALAYLRYVEAVRNDVVIVNVSGRGDKDMETYLRYLSL
jgi:tryptophan synthase beta chain